MSLSSQHRIIRPANRLHIKARFSDLSVSQMMAKAHRVMAVIAQSYSQCLRADLEALAAVQKKLQAQPNGAGNKAELFRISHDIRGQAASFGYDMASHVGTSLCQYLERQDYLGANQLKVVDAHINAIRAYLRQFLKGDGGAVGQAIMVELEALIQRMDPPQ